MQPTNSNGPVTPARQAFYDEIATQSLAPLWERLKGLVTPEPRPRTRAFGWKYAPLRTSLLKAGALLTTDEAERRVLIIENPGLVGQSRITSSLFGGLQLLMPGEKAASHRHVAGALRFIMEGDCAYTAVDGERTMMRTYDFVTTPSWTWHDHGNVGADPVIWLDGLDMHMVNLFEASFMEHYPDPEFPLVRADGDSEIRYGAALLPEGDKITSANSPLLNYRYDRARDALAAMAKSAALDATHGHKLRYVNPQTGGPPMPTISAAIQLLPKGFTTAEYRSTDATIFVCTEGLGRTQIGDFSFEWAPKDIFVAPSWAPVRHFAGPESVLFSYSDRAAQEHFGIWRERRDWQNTA